MHDPVAFATVLLVAVTAGLWFMTFLLWREAKETGKAQGDKMERSARAMEGVAASMAINANQIVESVTLQRQFGERHLRAVIDVQIGFGVYQDANNIFQASPRLINVGNSVAKRVRWRIAAGILPVPVPDELKFRCLPKELMGGVSIGPHQDGFMTAYVSGRVPDAEVEDIKRGRGKALYVWGYLIYNDGFRLRRRTFVQQMELPKRPHEATSCPSTAAVTSAAIGKDILQFSVC